MQPAADEPGEAEGLAFDRLLGVVEEVVGGDLGIGVDQVVQRADDVVLDEERQPLPVAVNHIVLGTAGNRGEQLFSEAGPRRLFANDLIVRVLLGEIFDEQLIGLDPGVGAGGVVVENVGGLLLGHHGAIVHGAVLCDGRAGGKCQPRSGQAGVAHELAATQLLGHCVCLLL